MATEKPTRHVILGLHILNRPRHIPSVQQILTEHGCIIRTRIGFHDVEDNYCSPSGVIMLDLCGTQEDQDKLENALQALDGVEVRKMVFDHGALPA